MLPKNPPCSFVPSTDGVRVAVHDLGGPDDPAAPVILFSHATGFHGRVFAPLAAMLAPAYRCLALDYRGHGLSELPDGAPLAWDAMGEDALAVLGSALIGPGRVVHGVGHSMGGAALVLAEARRPGTFRSLWLYEPVLIPPGVQLSANGDNPLAAGAERRRSSFGSLDEAVDNYASKPPLNQLHPDALRAYVSGGFSTQPDGTVLLRCLPATEAAVFRFAVDSGAWDALPGVRCPVAVVSGRSDDFGPAMFAASAVEALPHGQLVRRPALGHFAPLEDPGAMAGAIEEFVQANP